MRKYIVIALLTAVGSTTWAEGNTTDDKMIFNHAGLSVGVGTTGITVDVSTVCTPVLGIRAGLDLVPKFSIKHGFELDDMSLIEEYNSYQITDPSRKIAVGEDKELKVKLTPNANTGHVLLDIFPGKRTKFRFTVGAYFGSETIVKLHNREEGYFKDAKDFNDRKPPYDGISADRGRIGIEFSDYFLEPDEKGNVRASIRTQKIRPYVGIGVGRSVPKKRVACQFDAGVQFWGKPKAYLGDHRLEKGETTDEGDRFVKILNKINVYPTLSLRIVGRIF